MLFIVSCFLAFSCRPNKSPNCFLFPNDSIIHFIVLVNKLIKQSICFGVLPQLGQGKWRSVRFFCHVVGHIPLLYMDFILSLLKFAPGFGTSFRENSNLICVLYPAVVACEWTESNPWVIITNYFFGFIYFFTLLRSKEKSLLSRSDNVYDRMLQKESFKDWSGENMFISHQYFTQWVGWNLVWPFGV